MTLPAITSTRNPRVVAAARLHRARIRRETGLTLLEGPHLIGEATRTGAAVRTVFATLDDPAIPLAAAAGWEVLTVSRPVLERLSGTEQPQGPIAELEVPAPSPLPAGNCAVLWSVGDPGNVGTIIRSAAAFGFSVVIGPGTADPWSPKTLRAGAGGHFHTWVGAVADPAPPRLAPRSHVAAVATGGRPALPRPPLALYIGDEASGLPAAVVAACDFEVTTQRQTARNH